MEYQHPTEESWDETDLTWGRLRQQTQLQSILGSKKTTLHLLKQKHHNRMATTFKQLQHQKLRTFNLKKQQQTRKPQLDMDATSVHQHWIQWPG